jgi:hypothetical protein
LTVTATLYTCQNNPSKWFNGSFRFHSKTVVRSAALSRTAKKPRVENNDANGDNAPYGRGQHVKTPEGFGRVTAYSEVPGDWRLRVELDDGGFWLGSALVVSDAVEAKARRRTIASRNGGKA